MQIDFEYIKVLCGTKNMDKIKNCLPLKPFDETVCKWLSAISEQIMGSKRAKQYSDVISFAFFCRSANINRLKEEYEDFQEIRVGRGVVFHIAPGNVALNFAYSLVAALISGNASIIKISTKKFPQVNLIIELINTMLLVDEFSKLVPYINIWSYPNEYEKITQHVSACCDIRVIWGGNNTINRIRNYPLPPRAFDVTFADRSSICLLNAEKVAEAENINIVVQKFYNDTYLSDQNACTSPFLIIWTGKPETVEKAQEIFWNELSEYVKKNYDLKASAVVDKLDQICKAAIAFEGKFYLIRSCNFIYRLKLDKLEPGIIEYRCPGGFFFEYTTSDLEFLKIIVTSRYQTLSYYGYGKHELAEFIKRNSLRGLDRIVPIGRTMDFSLTWDGYDLLYTLSRRVTIA